MTATYAFKSYYKPLFIVFTLAALVAAVLTAFLGRPIVILMIVATVFNGLQLRLYTRPYISVEDGIATIRYTWLKSVVMNWNEVVRMSTQDNKLLLEMNDGSEQVVFLSSMLEEDKSRLKRDLSQYIQENRLV